MKDIPTIPGEQSHYWRHHALAGLSVLLPVCIALGCRSNDPMAAPPTTSIASASAFDHRGVAEVVLSIGAADWAEEGCSPAVAPSRYLLTCRPLGEFTVTSFHRNANEAEHGIAVMQVAVPRKRHDPASLHYIVISHIRWALHTDDQRLWVLDLLSGRSIVSQGGVEPGIYHLQVRRPSRP